MLTNDQYLLLKACQHALNFIPNMGLRHPIYPNTYALGNKVNEEVKKHEDYINNMVEDADCEPIIH